MLFTRHSVLKRGCSIWDKLEMPEEEFQGRLEKTRQEMVQRDLDALVIYGDNWCYADLCYLTNYFPKVRGGIGLVPRSGPISLLLNIGSRDVPFARSLTWVEDVRASNLLGRDGAELIKEKKLARARVGLVDSGKGFPLPQLEELKNALPQVEWDTCDSFLQRMRLRKSAREVAALRAAARVLNEVCAEAQNLIQTGKKEREVVAEIDRLGRNKGVEDIRILAGDKRLRPPGAGMNGSVKSHWSLYLAIQHRRYWVEAGRTFNLDDDAALEAAHSKARDTVGKMAACLKAGNAVNDADAVAREQLGELHAAASKYGLGNGLGLSQWEAPFLDEDEARQQGIAGGESMVLENDMAVALRVAFESESKLILFGDSYQVTPSGPVLLFS